MLTDSLDFGIQGRAIVKTKDGGFIAVGTYNKSNGLIIKLDSAGSPVWKKSFGVNSKQYSGIVFNSILSASDSAYIILGNSYDSVQSVTNALLIKINYTGDIIWSETIHEDNYNLKTYSLISTLDSGYAFVGTASKSNASNAIIAKITAGGALQWMNLFTLTGVNSEAVALQQLPDSNFVINGSIISSPRAYLLIKTNAAGSVKWAKYYNASSVTLSGNDLLVTRGGILQFLSITQNTSTDQKVLLKTDTAGNILWSKKYPSVTNINCTDCLKSKISPLSDGNYIFGYGGSVANTIVKTDSVGEIKISKSLTLMSLCVVETKNKAPLIFGNGPMIGVSPASQSPQIGLIQADSNLTEASGCIGNSNDVPQSILIGESSLSFTSKTAGTVSSVTLPKVDFTLQVFEKCVNIITGVKKVNSTFRFSVFPNPSSGTFDFSNPTNGVLKLRIYNPLGEKVYENEMPAGQTCVDLSHQPAGIYFYNVNFGQPESMTGKLVVLK